ncbi:hypothetical protein CRU94_07385 [Arcobacter sp. AHV-9/2010]|uniref:hypothetical protein n=1 Tax=Arcobacter sp. AHV-9/2010 TaxID=2021861 RepID=UPI00100A3E93|nr:hypothetical protein [Arcobacter sp. CECT 9299]RXJ94950.1 hypothetical protein CRU94_07385 [Arcobacter sp. CECT 9299]
MKKSYILFSTLIIVVIFSFVAKNILETNALKSRVVNEKLHFIQAKSHLIFLENYLLSMSQSELDNFSSLQIDDNDFLLTIKKYDDTTKKYFLVVSSSKFKVRVTKTIYL